MDLLSRSARCRARTKSQSDVLCVQDISTFSVSDFTRELAREMGVLESQVEVVATASSTRIEVRVHGNGQGSGVAVVDLLRTLDVSSLATSLNVGITTSMPAEERLTNRTVLTIGSSACPKGA